MTTTDGPVIVVPEALLNSEPHPFGSWSSTPVPKGPPGVYTIWRGEEFLYVGMSWKEPVPGSKAKGLWGRLDSHASGRRSGDQFCVYICDRFVIPTLSSAQLRNLETGARILDPLTKEYIRTHLAYRFVTTETGQASRDLERVIRGQGLTGHGLPLINPAAA